MKRSVITAACSILMFAGIAITARAQSGSIHSLSLNMAGSATNTSVRPGGCPVLVCTTNIVTINRCFTNCEPRLICVTNANGGVTCSNTLVCKVFCYTNTFPEITCTNEFLAPTREMVNQLVRGGIGTDGCDELGTLFPSNAVFEAYLLETLRTNDWRGTHIGSFRILADTNVFATGILSGVDGAGSHHGLENCAICNHLEGLLRGTIWAPGALHGASIQATYAGNYANVACPSATPPDGALLLGIEGVTIVPCPRFFDGDGFDPVATSGGAPAAVPVTPSTQLQ